MITFAELHEYKQLYDVYMYHLSQLPRELAGLPSPHLLDSRRTAHKAFEDLLALSKPEHEEQSTRNNREEHATIVSQIYGAPDSPERRDLMCVAEHRLQYNFDKEQTRFLHGFDGAVNAVHQAAGAGKTRLLYTVALAFVESQAHVDDVDKKLMVLVSRTNEVGCTHFNALLRVCPRDSMVRVATNRKTGENLMYEQMQDRIKELLKPDGIAKTAEAIDNAIEQFRWQSYHSAFAGERRLSLERCNFLLAWRQYFYHMVSHSQVSTVEAQLKSKVQLIVCTTSMLLKMVTTNAYLFRSKEKAVLMVDESQNDGVETIAALAYLFKALIMVGTTTQTVIAQTTHPRNSGPKSWKHVKDNHSDKALQRHSGAGWCSKNLHPQSTRHQITLNCKIRRATPSKKGMTSPFVFETRLLSKKGTRLFRVSTFHNQKLLAST